MTEIWQLLYERGTNKECLMISLGEETGLRGGEVANIRVQDIDLVKQTVFVRLPNKAMVERTALFGEKTKKYLEAWMAERNPNCGHDYLLHNSRGNPMKQSTFILVLRRVLCIWEREGKIKANETGLASFSFHRLRHTMASRMVRGGADCAAIMSQGGWATSEAMMGYAQPDPDRARRSYNAAMDEARSQAHTPKQRTTGFRVYRQREKESA
jgi:integrase